MRNYAIAGSLLAALLGVSNVEAQGVPAAARPGAAAAPAAPAPAAAPDVTSDVTSRDAPKAHNPVLEAFAPVAGGLTADEVARRAVATSETIEVKNAELRAAAARVDSAMYQFYPRVSVKAAYSRLSPVSITLGGGGNVVGARAAGPLGTNATGGVVDSQQNQVSAVTVPPTAFASAQNSYSLSASLTVPLSDYVLRLSSSMNAIKRNREATELNVQAERQKVEGDARIAFFNWSRSIGQVAITEKSLERVQARLRDAQAAFTVGAVTKAELLRLESLVAGTEATLETARAFRELAAHQLSIIMDSPEQDFALGEDVLAERAARPLEPLSGLVAEAQQRRVELRSMDKMVESMRSGEKVIRAGQLPRIDAFAQYDYANPNQRYLFLREWRDTWMAGVQATWTLNDILINGSSAAELTAQRQGLEAQRKAAAEGIRMEVSTAYTDSRKATAELGAAKRAAEASQAAYDTSVQLYRVGKATTSELIDAEAELVNANLKLVSAHIDTRVAETKLAKATGRELHGQTKVAQQ